MTITELQTQTMIKAYHYPVMYREVLELLEVANKQVVVDCTTGIGSHSCKILEAMSRDSLLVGIDKDQESLDIAIGRLKNFKDRFRPIKGNFSELKSALGKLKIESADAFLFDLGISMHQLSDHKRGFSFLKDGPLDMRMDRSSFFSAYDLVNNLSEIELENIFKKFGEERYARRIARSIVRGRQVSPILTTTELAKIITNSLPTKNRYLRIHPATRVFQSLRIAVNRELEVLKAGLEQAISMLRSKGRIAVISFHSLEDRIVKQVFREQASQGHLDIITKKPLQPGDEEIRENSASRSAKLRVAQKQ